MSDWYVKCRVYDTNCLNPEYCDARDACCAGDLDCMPKQLDLEKLEQEREEATIDKADLFDFYHKHWDKLIAEIRELRKSKESV